MERSALEPAVDPPKEDYEPLMFLEPAGDLDLSGLIYIAYII